MVRLTEVAAPEPCGCRRGRCARHGGMSHSLPAPLVLRPYGEDEWPAVYGLVARAFLGDPADAESRAVEKTIMNFDRTLAVFDGDQAVGSFAVFSLQMALPGGVRPLAGVSQVGVAGTHRRRGILRAMMTAGLERLHADGEPVAALWASEPSIYGRFGFGRAALTVSVTLPRPTALTAGSPGPDGTLDVVELPGGVDRLAPLHAAGLERRIGDFARDAVWWGHRTVDLPSGRNGAAPLMAVVHATDGVDDGYALVQLKQHWGATGPAGEVHVREVVAANPSAELSLWRYLLDVDLSASTHVRNLPLGSALLAAVVDLRRAGTSLGDNLYVRLVDVPRALSERSFAAEVDLVLEVRDEALPPNAGRWRVTSAGTTRTEDAADLSLDVRELGAVHLGGAGWGELARAGLVTEIAPGAVAAAAAAWALPGDLAAPACPMVF